MTNRKAIGKFIQKIFTDKYTQKGEMLHIISKDNGGFKHIDFSKVNYKHWKNIPAEFKVMCDTIYKYTLLERKLQYDMRQEKIKEKGEVLMLVYIEPKDILLICQGSKSVIVDKNISCYEPKRKIKVNFKSSIIDRYDNFLNDDCVKIEEEKKVLRQLHEEYKCIINKDCKAKEEIDRRYKKI